MFGQQPNTQGRGRRLGMINAVFSSPAGAAMRGFINRINPPQNLDEDRLSANLTSQLEPQATQGLVTPNQVEGDPTLVPHASITSKGNTVTVSELQEIFSPLTRANADQDDTSQKESRPRAKCIDPDGLP